MRVPSLILTRSIRGPRSISPATNYETTFREKFQLPSDQSVDGLSPIELALEHGSSHATIILDGQLHRVFELVSSRNLEAIARVLRRIKMPQRARELKTKLKSKVSMVQTSSQLFDVVCKHNWRILPVQFGLPTQSHLVAELIRAAGFEGILYRSSKGSGECLAVFPDLIDASSFIELVDPPPASVMHRRLDGDSATALAGWDTGTLQRRPR